MDAARLPRIPPTLGEEELWRLVGTEESAVVDFKEQLAKPGHLQDPCVAFANHRGGLVMVGISKRRPPRVLGTTWDQGDEERVQEAVRATQPPLQIDVETHAVDGRRIAVLRVAPAENGWVQTSDGRVLVRSGPTNRALVGMELLRFLRERASTPVEDEVVRDASVADLDRRLVHRYLTARLPDRGVRVADALRDLGWIDRREHPRLAALLVFGRRPQRDNRRFGVDLLRFAGAQSGGAALRERRELHGPIPLLVEQAQRAIDDALRRDAVVRGLVREELPAYPPVVVREALLNATAHRDYAARGSAVQVRIYDDALEIESPGTLPAYVTVETLREAQYSRNERIMDALQRLALVEEAGQGVDRMFAEMEAAFLEPPEFAERAASFVVTLRSRTSLPAEDRLWIARFADLGLTADARTALVQAHRRGSISNEELRTLRELDREASRRTLQELVARGLLERVGERRGTRYVLGPATRHAKRPGLDARLRVVVRHAQRHGAVANADVRTLLDVDRTAARMILSELVALGRLRPVGERRGRRYLPVER